MEDLLAMGFDEESVRAAVTNSNNNFDHALECLLGGTGMPAAQEPQPNLSSNPEQNIIALEVSQYSFEEGTSACTSIACAAALYILAQPQVTEVTQAGLSEALFTGISYYNEAHSRNSAVDHLNVEDLISVLPQEMKIRGQLNGVLSHGGHFENSFINARELPDIDASAPIGLIITKPPETILCILPPKSLVGDLVGDAAGAEYAFFDSHARPQLGLEGAHMRSSASQASIIQSLQETFPYFDLGGEAEDNNLAAQMYNFYDITIVQLAQTP